MKALLAFRGAVFLAGAFVLPAGCGGDQSPSPLTNGPPPGIAGEKPAVRTDLPPPSPPRTGEVLGELGDGSTNAGTGGRSPAGATPSRDGGAQQAKKP
jgi:hypothetical protein